MNLMFWKKKPKTGEEADTHQDAADDKTVAMEVPDLETPSKPGLLTRVKSGLAGLVRRFKKSPAPDEENEAEVEAPNKHASPVAQASDAPPIRPRNTKKRLIIGGAISLLILLLAGAGFAAWKIFLSPPEHDTADAAPSSQTAAHGEDKLDETPQAEIETLRKKNQELQAQIEALKKEPPPDQPSSPSTGTAGGNAASPPETGDLTISNKDPKAAAQVLKEAIEAMNAGSGGSAGKPAK